MPRELKPWEHLVVQEDGRRVVEGPGYAVEVDENDEPVDILFFVSPSAMRRRKPKEDEGGSAER